MVWIISMFLYPSSLEWIHGVLCTHQDYTKNGVFWDVTPLRRNTNFFAACVGCWLQLALFLVHRFLSPWWRTRWVPPKRRFLQEPHGVTSQKTSFFIVTAVKTSNLTSGLHGYTLMWINKVFLRFYYNFHFSTNINTMIIWSLLTARFTYILK
jgi:hypothetical protein